MKITFWGVRGSIATPGPDFCRYGGNTACVSVETQHAVLILDAGTGIRPLGEALAGSAQEIFLLLSHAHGDHVHGFPFFGPLHTAGRVVHVLDYDGGGRDWSVLDLLDGFHFPRRVEDLAGHPLRVGGDVLRFLDERGFAVRRLPVNHPGGAYGYRVGSPAGGLVYIPDNELDPAGPVRTPYEEIVAFCRGASVLVHDAQYLASELADRRDWGHSTFLAACRLAADAGVRHLVLFHHDPYRTDPALDQLQDEARSTLRERGVGCTAAYEGLTLEI